MLRLLVLVLLVANLAYAAWSQSWMALPPGWLPSPTPTREPQRLDQQLNPERMQVLSATAPTPSNEPNHTTTEATAAALPPEPPSPDTAAPSADRAEPTRCIQVAALNDKQFGVLRIALVSGLPDSGWVVNTSTQPARWLVYSGKLSSPAIMAAKKTELRDLKVEFREVTTPALQPGLAMGTYSSEERAQQALKDVTRAGVKGARVVPERLETTLTTVQWPKATDSLQGQVQTLLQRLADEGLEGKLPQPCP